MIYLDNAATTKPFPEVTLAMIPYLTEDFGNPSSVHDMGFKAKDAVENARKVIAKSINARPEEIYFTSGGSESNNWALKGTAFALKNKGNHIITTSIEHHSVLNACKWLETQGFEVTYLPVDHVGKINSQDILKYITEKTILISVMTANNEIGTVEPIQKVARIAQDKGILFHTDSTQAYCHLPIDVKAMGIDMLTASAHKIHGPKGVGFLYIAKDSPITQLIHGGQQERGFRASTENVPGIVGFAKAVECCGDPAEFDERMTNLWYLFNSELRELGGHLNGAVDRIANNLSVTFKGIRGEVLLELLNESNVYASSGSACDSESGEPSHVLKAIGLTDEEANSTIRFSMSHMTTRDDIWDAINTVARCLAFLRG